MGVEHVDNNKVIVNMEVRDSDGIHNDLITGINIPNAQAKRKASLKRCPFCGNEAVMIEYNGGHFPKCTCCDCMIALQISVVTETIIPFETEDEAIEKWNTRKGALAINKFTSNAADTAETILRKREDRADAIAEVIRNGAGEVVYIAEITQDTGMCRSTVENNMRYAKKKYPAIHSRKGHKGYFWEENEDE